MCLCSDVLTSGTDQVQNVFTGVVGEINMLNEVVTVDYAPKKSIVLV